MPTVGNFTWESIERPVIDGTQLEVGDGKTYATIDDAIAAASLGDTITVFANDIGQSFIWNGGDVIQVGTGQDYATVQEAYAASSSGDTILIHEGTYAFNGNEYYPESDHSEPILISHDINIIGVGTVVFDIGYVEKGALVTNPDTDQHLYVENITFTGAYGNSRNSSGIRHQSGDLTVVDSTFLDSESGILALETTGTVHVVGSYFDGIGSDGFSHALYIQGDRLIVEDSHFVDAIHGQHVKSTTHGDTIVVNSILDDGTGSSSYAVDIGGGGDIMLDGNSFIKGAGADNSTFVWYDANRFAGDPGDVWIQNNSFDATAYPNADYVKVVVNRTYSDINLVNNTVDGVLEEKLIVGIGHIENVTLDGALLSDTTATEHTTFLTAADDVYISESTNGTNISGGDGGDSMVGLSGADTLWGSTGNDFLVGDDGADYLLGGANDDTLYGGSGADMLYGDTGKDLLISGAGTADERLHGGAGDDTLSIDLGYANGGTGNDVIVGTGSGRATLQGGDGDDIVYGGQGGDALYGGDGVDIAIFSGVYNPNDLENSDFSIELKAAWSSTMVVKGLTEAGMLEVGDGVNYWNGEIFYDDKEAFVDFEKLQFDNGVYDVATGTFTEGLQLVDLEAIVNDIPGDSNLSDPIVGTDEDDIFAVNGVSGFTTYDGGLGNDQIQFVEDGAILRLSAFNARDVETITANSHTNVSILSNSSDNLLDFSGTSLVGIDHIDTGLGDDTIIGSDTTDVIIAGLGNDRALGGAGDDLFIIGPAAGTDYIDGQSGTDAILLTDGTTLLSLSNTSFSSEQIEAISSDITGPITMMAGTSGIHWNLSGIALTNITAISSTLSESGDVYVAANVQSNVSGGAGHDAITGSQLADTLVGGVGDDTLAGGDGDDVFLYAQGDGQDSFDGGNGFDQILITGADTTLLAGAFTNIELISSNGYANVSISGSIWDDTIDFSGVTLDGIALLTTSSGNDSIIGSSGDDIIAGGSGTDSMNGGDGDDIFLYFSGDGTDYYTGGNGQDQILVMSDGSTVTIRGLSGIEIISANGHSNVSISGSSWGETLDFSSTILIDIVGIHMGAGDDNVTGSAGNDTISGGDGFDALFGGAGNDVFEYSDGEGRDSYDGGDGTDTLRILTSDTTVTVSSFTGIEAIDASGLTDVAISSSQYGSLDLSNTVLTGAIQILGGTGHNMLVGSGGDDVIDGGAGNDTLAGGNGSDIFAFGASWGADMITDFAEGDILNLSSTGLVYADLNIAQSGLDTIISDVSGNSIRVVGADAQSFYNANLIIAGAPTELPSNGSFIQGTNSSETLTGTADADTIEGLGGSDVLYGGAGDDVFLYTKGDSTDRFFGEEGNDTLIISGGELYVGSFEAGDVEAITSTGAKIQGSWRHNEMDFSQTSLTGIALIDGGDGSDTIHGSQADDTIMGNGGGDKLFGEGGDDTFLIGSGGSGADTYDGGAGIDTIQATADDARLDLADFVVGAVEHISSNGYANMTIASTWRHNTLDFSETVLTGIAEISGGDGNDIIHGSQGDDTLNGNKGGDTLFGEGGLDTFRVDSEFDNDVIADFTEGETIDLYTTNYTFASLVITQVGANTQIADANGKKITLLDTDASTIDEADFNFAPPVGIIATQDTEIIDVGTNFATGQAPQISAGGHSGVSIGTSGSNQNNWDFSQTILDAITLIDGAAGDDTVRGSQGDDTIMGSAGFDHLYGEGGDDTFLYASGDGLDRYYGGGGYDRVLATTDDTVLEIRSVFDIEEISANGHVNVSLSGSVWDDVLDFSSTLLSTITLIDAKSGNDHVTGTSDDDTIAGGVGTDTIDGGDGNDTFLFSSGDDADYYTGGNGQDQILATADDTAIGIRSLSGIETISANGYTGILVVGSGWDDTLDFSGTTLDGIVLIALEAGNDQVTGSSGDDTISGGVGTDSMNGGDGNDTFLVGAGDGADYYIGGNGQDQILATADDTAIGIRSLSGIETISANGYTGILVVGSGWDDTLDFSGTTLDGIVLIALGSGNDNIVGSTGNDVISGGTGTDTMSGGAGDDVFVFEGGTDVITDFEQGDIMDLSATGLTFGDISLEQSGNNTLVDYGSGNTIILQDTLLTDIDSSDFTF